MHAFGRFIQAELDARGWRQAELVRKSGLQRQHLSKLLNDRRDYLGQMPDEHTLTRIAAGFELPVATVRAAAARALVGYEDSGESLTFELTDVSTDALLNEIRRRIDANTSAAPQTPPEPGTPGQESKNQEAKVYAFTPPDQDDDLDDPEPDYSLPGVAYTPKLGEKGSKEAWDQDELADRPDPEGPEEGA